MSAYMSALRINFVQYILGALIERSLVFFKSTVSIWVCIPYLFSTLKMMLCEHAKTLFCFYSFTPFLDLLF